MVSIIIPTYNRANLLRETLESVSKQIYNDWECLVVDDGSTDNTEEIVEQLCKSDNRFKYLKRPDSLEKGANSCRNYGFEKSKGDFIQWFDSDDIMLKNFLSKKIEEFKYGIQFVICSGYYWESESNSKKSITFYNLEDSLFEDYLQWKIKILTPSVLFRRVYLEKKILFNNSIKRGQETDFFSRIFFKAKDNEYKIIPHHLFLYRQHLETKTFKNQKYNTKYKLSLFTILYDNFERAQLIKSKVLSEYIFKKIIDLFFLSIANSDRKLSKLIMKIFFPLITQLDFIKGKEIQVISEFLLLFNYSSDAIKKRWKSFIFKWYD